MKDKTTVKRELTDEEALLAKATRLISLRISERASAADLQALRNEINGIEREFTHAKGISSYVCGGIHIPELRAVLPIDEEGHPGEHVTYKPNPGGGK